MKIDFTKIEVYASIDRKTCFVKDIKNEFANAIYTNIAGLPAHALAYKIYNSKGEEEFSDDECRLISHCAEVVLTPEYIDALKEVFKRGK